MAKKSHEIRRIDDEFEAYANLVAAMFYFITHPFKGISLLVFGLFFSNLGLHYYNISADKAHVTLAPPMSEARTFSLFPEAIASDTKVDTIRIKGRAYGIKDPTIDAWKLRGEPAVLLYDKTNDVVIKARVEGLDHERMKQLKKGD